MFYGDVFEVIIPFRSEKAIIEGSDSLRANIIQYVHEHGSISNTIMREEFGTTKSRATESLEASMRENILMREGNGRNTIYRLIID